MGGVGDDPPEARAAGHRHAAGPHHAARRPARRPQGRDPGRRGMDVVRAGREARGAAAEPPASGTGTHRRRPDGPDRHRPRRRPPRRRLPGVREGPDGAGVDRRRARLPQPGGRRQPRQRERLPRGSARAGGDNEGRPAGGPQAAPGDALRPGLRNRRPGHHRHQRLPARHEAHRRRHVVVLPARVLLDEHEARRAVPENHGAREAPWRGRARAQRLPRADRSGSGPDATRRWRPVNGTGPGRAARPARRSGGRGASRSRAAREGPRGVRRRVVGSARQRQRARGAGYGGGGTGCRRGPRGRVGRGSIRGGDGAGCPWPPGWRRRKGRATGHGEGRARGSEQPTPQPRHVHHSGGGLLPGKERV